jgi:hypothetical protein
LQTITEENQRLLTEMVSDKSNSQSELMMTIAQLRTQNEKMQIQLCGMCKQETLDQLTISYENELTKERSKVKDLNR